MEKIKEINDILLSFLWGKTMIFLIISTGLLLCVRTGFFHIFHPFTVIKATFLSLLCKKVHKKGKGEISPFQSVSTALSSTLGTGNIIGVAAALTIGGEGTVFWMWISAFIGMMIKFSENALSVHFSKNKKGGPMYYIRDGMSRHCLLNPLSKPLSVLYAIFCTLASFGVGNMVQSNSMSSCLYEAFSIPPIISGIIFSVVVFVIIYGGITSVATVTEKTVPYMSTVYTLGCIFIIITNIENLFPAFVSIFKNAFDAKSIAGGVIMLGFRRGIFSNEAGLGASSVSYAASSASSISAGMWGIFEVFFDTAISCTLTALAILCSGISFSSDSNAAVLINESFSSVFGSFASPFIAVMMSLFAFSTILGWCVYGCSCTEFLFGKKGILPYKTLYSFCVIIGSFMHLSLVWEISDTLNALMAIPNLIALICLSGTVKKIAMSH